MTGDVMPRLDRIVIGMDFGEPSLGAAAWVANDFAPEAELVLVHALGLEPAPLGGPLREVTEPVATVARDFAAERLRRVAERLGPKARVEVRDGPPPPVISEVAHESGADLTVVGPHGGHDERPSGIGSTAERLVRVSSIPVLVATNTPSGRLRRVLVPVDDVDLTASVLEWTGLLMRRDGVAVTLMHIVREPGELGAAETWLTRLVRDIHGGGPVTIQPMVGEPGVEIIAAARRLGVDLIVMGRRGKGREHPGVLGSTVHHVLERATCPVLLVADSANAILDGWGTETEHADVS